MSARRWAALAAWKQANYQRELLGNAWTAAQRPRLFSLRHEMTRQEVVDMLQLGPPTTVTADGDTGKMRWEDAATGSYLEIEYRPGRVGPWRLKAAAVRIPQPPNPRSGFSERVRLAVMRVSPPTWAILLLLCIAWAKRRLMFAELTMAAGLVCFFGWLVNPGYTATLKGVFSNDILFWGAVMLVMSAAAWVWCHLHRWRPREPLACPKCEYNLTGNVSGVCPECGWTISPELRQRIAAAPVGADRPTH